MIYQCYFRADQRRRLFPHAPYCGFGLEPDLNPQLLDQCPELADPDTRTALTEYAAMLNVWRRAPQDHDGWVGFTSYRQLDKSDVVFDSSSALSMLLARHDLVAWHVWAVGHMRFAGLSGAAAQAEWAHCGLHRFTVDVLANFGHTLPLEYFTADEIPFANYWAMPHRHFQRFMEWSWPLIEYARAIDHDYKHSPPRNPHDDKRKAVGYFAERLFIIWALQTPLRRKWLGRIQRGPL